MVKGTFAILARTLRLTFQVNRREEGCPSPQEQRIIQEDSDSLGQATACGTYRLSVEECFRV